MIRFEWRILLTDSGMGRNRQKENIVGARTMQNKDIYICICIYARIHARDFPRTINHGRRRIPGRGGERRRWWKKRERVETRGINDPLKIIPAYSTGYQPALLLSRNVWRIDQNPVQSIALLYPDTNRITVG